MEESQISAWNLHSDALPTHGSTRRKLVLRPVPPISIDRFSLTKSVVILIPWSFSFHRACIDNAAIFLR